MNGRFAVVRLYIVPGRKYWAYTPLQNGAFLVLYAALGRAPTFAVADSAPEDKKRKKGYELQGDILLCDLDNHVSLSTSQRNQMVEQAASHEVCFYDDESKTWTWNPGFSLPEADKPKPAPRVMPDIVIDDSIPRYTW